jgi:hypothetical protein
MMDSVQNRRLLLFPKQAQYFRGVEWQNGFMLRVYKERWFSPSPILVTELKILLKNRLIKGERVQTKPITLREMKTFCCIR